MIRIEAIKININTSTGIFGRTLHFEKGLNIIRANNTSGKSSIFGSVIYGLGFEELLGSRNEKALQSVFKSVVKELVNHNRNEVIESTVLQSEIYLQISNGNESITTKRYIVNKSIRPQAIEVFLGKQVSDENAKFERISMYVHDSGASTNEEVGFHKFLQNFIGLTLPEIINQDGRKTPLYLPLLASAHYIEQKSGWSDFYANMPYYGIRDAQSKVFEYLLNFDVFDVAAKRQIVLNLYKTIEEKWKIKLEAIRGVVKRGGGEIIGIPDAPEILSNEVKPYTRFYRAGKSFLIEELIEKTKNDLKEVYESLKVPLNQNIDKIQASLNQTKEQVNRYEILYDSLHSEISQQKERIRGYNMQLRNVEEDLRKNKDVEKIQRLGLEENLKLGNSFCPTCNQEIQDLLFEKGLNIIPMRIDENIDFLNAQQKMIEAFIANLKEIILDKETQMASLETAIQEGRAKIRSLKKDLISDDRLPSEEIIERKVVLEREHNFLVQLREDIDDAIDGMYEISEEFRKYKIKESELPKEYLSYRDKAKISFFEERFKSLLSNFKFTSKQITSIKISTEKYTPVYEVRLENGITRQVDIRFESSASDFIRVQWAYYLALMQTSLLQKGNHFLSLMFDEPQQQSASNQSFKAFLDELQNCNKEQSIVFASFQNSQEDFVEATKHLVDVNIIDLVANSNEMLISRL